MDINDRLKLIRANTKESQAKFCKRFSYKEMQIKYPVEKITFKVNSRGCRIEFPLSADEHIYGLGDKGGKLDKAGRAFRIETADCMGYDAAESDEKSRIEPPARTHAVKEHGKENCE